MFQCLGLGTHETGGCGEDWYHPGCVVGLGPKWFDKMEGKKAQTNTVSDGGALSVIVEDAEAAEGDDDEDPPNPPGFPSEENFETFICFKCVEAHPWIKRYAGTPGFLSPVFRKVDGEGEKQPPPENTSVDPNSKKRKVEDEESEGLQDSKRHKNALNADDVTESEALTETKTDDEVTAVKDEATSEESKPETCKYKALPHPPEGVFSLFCAESFRDRFCRCAECFPNLGPHTQLLEEEEIYEPPISEEGSENGGSTHGSGSLYERGESALRNVDRVRAIEGVMAYNQLKDKLTPFFQQFAESGKAISAEDIKEYFAKMRGDEEAIKEAGESAKSDQRKEQPGY